MHTSLLTKDQCAQLFNTHNVSEPLPTRKTKVVICFPGKALDLAEVALTDMRATYGGKLYQVIYTSKQDRLEHKAERYLKHMENTKRYSIKSDDKLTFVTDTTTGDEFVFGDDQLARTFVKNSVTELDKAVTV